MDLFADHERGPDALTLAGPPANLPVRFIVLGEPQGKGRARSTLIRKRDGTQFISNYTPEKTRSYEAIVRYAAEEAMGTRDLFRVPVDIEVFTVHSVPASWSRKKRADALAGLIRPGKKPDWDNIIKAVTDACNGVVFADDALIVRALIVKVYGLKPQVSVSVALA